MVELVAVVEVRLAGGAQAWGCLCRRVGAPECRVHRAAPGGLEAASAQ